MSPRSPKADMGSGMSLASIALRQSANGGERSEKEMNEALSITHTVLRERRRWSVRMPVRVIQFMLDVSGLIAAFVLSYLLRFDFRIPATEFPGLVHQLPYAVLIQITVLMLAGVYSFIWRYVGFPELKTFLGAACASAIPLFALRLFLPASEEIWKVPLSIIAMDTVFVFGFLFGMRVLRRGLYEHQARRRSTGDGTGAALPTLLVGAGQAGVLAAREILNRGDMQLAVKGFVDDDPAKQGAVIHDFRVVGTTDDLPKLVKDLKIAQVVITIARITRGDIVRIIDICHAIPVKIRIIPGLYEILQGKVQVTRIRNVQIEDLLGRAGDARRKAAWGLSGRQAGHGHRGRRLDRVRACASGRALFALAAPLG